MFLAMANPGPKSIEGIHRSLSEREYSAEELTGKYLRTIAETEPRIHAFLEVFEERALKEAALVDEKLRNGDSTDLLTGVPIALKDNILVKGTRTTAASRILESYIASYDAFVVRRLRERGAIFIGKTNLDEFAMGSSTENSAFGATHNPHDEDRVPGGSSGGSAAAVASGECIAALGSDTGGSIRQPASFCGIVGLKPTYGSVSRSGLIAMASSLDQIGPLTHSVRDAEIIFEAISGKDPWDSTSVESNIKNPKSSVESGLRIGIPKEYFSEGLDPEILKTIKKAISTLQAAGFKLQDISLPHTEYALACYYIIMPAEVSANLARFDGIRYGFSKKERDLLSVYTKTRSQGFGLEVRRRIVLGTYVLSSGYHEAYYGQAQKVRTLVKRDFDEAFKDVDVIATPTTPTLPFRIGEKTKDPLSMYLSDVYTVPVNLAGLPALSVPCGKVGGLPTGIQFIGKAFQEHELFALGKKYEEARGAI